MRSRICRSSTSRGGRAAPLRSSCRTTVCTRSSSPRWVITSLLTTATMRSASVMRSAAGWATARALPDTSMQARAKRFSNLVCIGAAAVRGPGRYGVSPIKNIALPLTNEVRRRVAGDIPSQRLERVRSDARKAVEFELQEHHSRFLIRSGFEIVEHQPENPAVGIIFKAEQPFDHAAAVGVVVDPAHPVPAPAKRPLRREVDRADFLVNGGL